MQNQLTPPPTGDDTTAVTPVATQPVSRSAEQKSKAKSLLSRLDPRQSMQLVDWLTKHSVSDVLGMVAAPPPEGFGIHTHYTTLRRFKSQLHAGLLSDDLQNMFDMCHDVAEENPSLDLPNVQSILSAMLHERAFTLLRNSADTSEINKLIDAISKISSLEFKRQKLAREHQQSLAPKHHRVDLNIVPPRSQPPVPAVQIAPPPPAAAVSAEPALQIIADNPQNPSPEKPQK
jgi:hypothetical protein